VGSGLVELLAGGQGVAVDGGNEAEGDGVNGLINVGVCPEKYLHCSR